jgi:hypothetical protein
MWSTAYETGLSGCILLYTCMTILYMSIFFIPYHLNMQCSVVMQRCAAQNPKAKKICNDSSHSMIQIQAHHIIILAASLLISPNLIIRTARGDGALFTINDSWTILASVYITKLEGVSKCRENDRVSDRHNVIAIVVYTYDRTLLSVVSSFLSRSLNQSINNQSP